jgi:hypothetical protein
MSLDELRPARLNGQIYKPVDPADPSVRDLADDIQRNGLLQHLLVTRDRVILAGHRRRVACQIAGLKEVPVQVHPIDSTDPEFPGLLVAANNQRVKTFDEILREEVVKFKKSGPGDAHRRLLEHRRRRAGVEVEAIRIEGTKHRCKISRAKRPMLDAVLQVLRDYRDFLPVTLRRVHYALLSLPPFLRHAGKPERVFYRGKWRSNVYSNDLDSYKDLSNLLTRARHEGIVPWPWVHDPTRPVTSWDCQPDVQAFVREQFEGFLQGYHRDYLQSQPNLVELVGEKLTLDGVIRPVVAQYGIRITVGRGYSSYPMLKEMAERFRKSGKEKLIVLFVSDHDPEGEDIPHAFARCLRDDHGIPEERLVPKKVALTAEQVRELGLPPQMKVKEGSSRGKKFRDRYGDDVFEVEAVPPVRLQAILREGIDSVLDLDAFNAEVDREAEDSDCLEGLRPRIAGALVNVCPPGGEEGR